MKNLVTSLVSGKPESLGRAFVRYGWIGFWLQVILAVFSAGLMIYVLFFSQAAAIRVSGMGLTGFLAIGGLLILLFTICLFYRYQQLGRKMADPETRPPKASVNRTLWMGLWASCFGIAFSMLLMIIEVSRLLFLLLREPLGGVPVIQTETYNPSTWVSAIDMVGLLADLCVLAAELIVLALTLWLLLKFSLAGGYERKPKARAS